MSKPETQDYLLIGPEQVAGLTVTVTVSTSSKLRDLADTYFRHMDPEYGDADRAVSVVKQIFLKLGRQDQVSPDTEGAQWVLTDEGYGTVLPDGDLEAVLAGELKLAYGQDPLDDDNPESQTAQLALGMALDLCSWANKQFPAELKAIAERKAEEADLEARRAKFPSVVETAKYFVLSDGDQPTEMCFDALAAFESESQYIDVFDDKGKRVQNFKSLPEGYTDAF